MSPLLFIVLLSFLPFPILAIATFTQRRMKPAKQVIS